jgi:hypothetical protein
MHQIYAQFPSLEVSIPSSHQLISKFYVVLIRNNVALVKSALRLVVRMDCV